MDEFMKTLSFIIGLIFVSVSAKGQELYQKSWLIDVGLGSPMLKKGETNPVQARISVGYEIQFTESGLLGLAMRGGYAITASHAYNINETGLPSTDHELLYSYTGNSFFAAVSPMLIFEQYDSNVDRIFAELELELASHGVNIKFYEPNPVTSSNWVYFKGFFALKIGLRVAWEKNSKSRAMSIWGALHNQSPIDAIDKSIPVEWPYKFNEDLNSQWQVGISVYL